MKRMMYLVGLTLTCLAATLTGAQTPSSSGSQNQAAATSGSSLGDYARHLRKDNAPAKARPKVFDNDNLPKDDKLSIVGAKAPASAPTETNTQEAQAAEAKSTTREANAVPGSADETKQKQAMWKQWQDKIASQKGQIDLTQRELDVVQREYQVRAAAFYADAGNRLRNQAGWDKQDSDYKQQIADKTKALADAKDKLDEMNEEARKAGVPSSMIE